MSTPQTPINSGFGHDSTAAQVLDGVDLAGKTAMVTGGYSGLGYETTKALAAAGANVIVPARRPEHAAEVLGALDAAEGSITIVELDLGDLANVSRCAEGLLTNGTPIDLLINNAAIMACPETRIGPGWEAQFATNHLGHYALVNRIWPLIADGGGRVVALSSTGHKRSAMRWDDLQWETEYDKWGAYGQAKTANSLFAVQLDALGESAGVRSFAVHPGGIMTPLQRHLPQEEMIAMGWVDEAGKVHEAFKSTEQGAATSVWAATASVLDGMGGVYCDDCNIAPIADPDNPRGPGVMAHAVDADEAARLWALSAELTGVDAFA